MTNTLKAVMTFILKKYPSKYADEMSNARLTKIVYLADWKNCLENGETITSINWYFDNYGPFVNNIKKTAQSYPDIFKIEDATNMYGQPKKIFKLKDNDIVVDLNKAQKSSITSIVDETSKLYWKAFIKLVYSTHPVASSDRYSYLDLVAKSQEYKKIRESRV